MNATQLDFMFIIGVTLITLALIGGIALAVVGKVINKQKGGE